MKRIALILIAPVIALSASSIAHAAPLGGQNCDTPGAARRANNGRFVCSPEGGTSTWRRVNSTGTIVDVVSSLRGYSIFESVLRTSGLDTELAAAGPYTVFAPRNAAFLSLGSGLLDALQRPDNAENLKRILRYHVIRGRVTAREMVTGEYLTLDGTQLRVVAQNNIRVDGGRVTMGDVRATNGIVHGVSKVFIPAGVAVNP
jgi:uncharacterized surface protein with fasciclin (FAS1) repeats